VSVEGEGQILDSILSGAKGSAPRVRQRSADPAFDRFLAEIADASVDRTDTVLARRWQDAIDAATGARLRAIVTHPSLRRLEALWRSLFGLARRASLCEGECRVRLRGVETLEQLAEVSLAEDRPFDLIVVDPVLDSTPARDLDHLTAFAERVATPCLAGLRADFGGALPAAAREHPGAARMGVCLPRLLLRLPYGRDGEAVDGFPFDELSRDEPDYLWANPAFAVAEAVVAVRDATGQAQDLGEWASLTGLPQHVRREAFENLAVGPLEALFTESQVQTLIGGGLIPLVGFRNRDEARIAGLRSLRGSPLFSR
jgi:type VI secretion system protein ImpC